MKKHDSPHDRSHPGSRNDQDPQRRMGSDQQDTQRKSGSSREHASGTQASQHPTRNTDTGSGGRHDRNDH